VLDFTFNMFLYFSEWIEHKKDHDKE